MEIKVSALSARSAERLLHTRREVDKRWDEFVALFEDYDSIAEINLKVDDLILDFGRMLSKEEDAGCEHNWLTISRTCGVRICDDCGEHEGLARCFCGWNLAPGERLEDDVDY